MRKLLCGLAAVTTLAYASPAAAELVYTSSRCDPACHSAVWRVADDGTGAQRVLQDAATPAFDLLGTRIAYAAGGGPAETALHVMDADGSERRRITPATMNAFDPAWSPSGALIAFTATDRNGVCMRTMLVDPEGATEPVPMPGTECGDRLPRFSPDGLRIIHLRHGDTPGAPASIVSRPVAGGPSHEVIAAGNEVGPFTLAFSPDGRMLGLALRGTIYTLDLVTGELVPRSDQDSDIAWSPLGPTLFFSKQTADGRGSAIHRLDVGTPGATAVPVTDGLHRDYRPSWGALGIALPELPRLDVLPPLVALLPADVPVARAASRSPGAVVAASRLRDVFATDPSGVRALDVALARQAGSRCRAVRTGRVERRRRTCRARFFRRTGADRIAARTERLPRGTYRVWIRATDGAGNRASRPRMLRVRV
jgi:hypothetical protein